MTTKASNFDAKIRNKFLKAEKVLSSVITKNQLDTALVYYNILKLSHPDCHFFRGRLSYCKDMAVKRVKRLNK